jgi:cytochrome c peroxidase
MVISSELDTELDFLIAGKSPDGTTDYYILPDGSDLSELPQDPQNPITEAKVRLGKFLFFETGLAQDAVQESGIGTYSCATCHIPEAGFKSATFQGIADGGEGYGIDGDNRVRNTDYTEAELDVQSARPLTMVNVGFVTNTFWNGQFGATEENVGTEHLWDNNEDTERNHQGFEGIETQNFEGLIAHRIAINKELIDSLGYTEMFDEAFADIDVSERYTQRTGSFAFSAYIRSIMSDKAPFQEYLKGFKGALTYEEKKGAILFFGKALCNNCHYKQNLGSLEFHALGVKDMYQRLGGSFDAHVDDKRNLGRGGFTLLEEDNYKFKVPGIYNVEDTPFLFHGSSVDNLEELVDYKNLALTENPNVDQELISEKFLPLNLTEEEKSHLVEFIRNGLKDPDLIRYKPTDLPSGNCFPNADALSVTELGCN